MGIQKVREKVERVHWSSKTQHTTSLSTTEPQPIWSSRSKRKVQVPKSLHGSSSSYSTPMRTQFESKPTISTKNLSFCWTTVPKQAPAHHSAAVTSTCTVTSTLSSFWPQTAKSECPLSTVSKRPSDWIRQLLISLLPMVLLSSLIKCARFWESQTHPDSKLSECTLEARLWTFTLRNNWQRLSKTPHRVRRLHKARLLSPK